MNIIYNIKKLWHRIFPKKAFSNYCTCCGGSGGWIVYGGYFEPCNDWSDCPDCACPGVCPGCASNISADDWDFLIQDFDHECPFCKWTFNKGLEWSYQLSEDTETDWDEYWLDDDGEKLYYEDYLDLDFEENFHF